MMVSGRGYFLRGKRTLEKWSLVPPLRGIATAVGFAGAGLVLGGVRLWGQMMPVGAALVLMRPGLPAAAAALGSAAGYRLLWGAETGLQGVMWSLGALMLRLFIRGRDRLTAAKLAGLFGFFVGALALGFQILLRDNATPQLCLLRIAAAGIGGVLALRLDTAGDRLTRMAAASVGVLALTGLPVSRWVNPGFLAAGVMAAAGPSPGAALAGVALDIAGVTAVPMTAVMCMCTFLRMLPVRSVWWRRLHTGAAAVGAMALLQSFDLPAAVLLAAGGFAADFLPWHPVFLVQTGNTGAAQVYLEQMARLMSRLQLLLLESPSEVVDEEAMVQRLRQNACGSCSFRDRCADTANLGAETLRDPLSFQCRKTGRVLQELRACQGQLRLIRAGHRRQREYRSAMLQQYAFLSDWMRHMADCLPRHETDRRPQFRLQVSARAAGKERVDGDRCMAFPGVGCRYYVIMCDGMGSGLGAAEEGRRAAALLRQMLCAGLPAKYALGSINSHLVLRGQAGAVTVDLAEIRLDSGKAAIYKWGAPGSWLVRRRKAQKIGTASPPPGISVTEMPQTAVGLSLSRGEVLILVSDGVEIGESQDLADRAADFAPGELAEWILEQWGGSGEDDATAAVIRLRPTSLAT